MVDGGADGDFDGWFEANRILLETAYLKGREPWQQSGVGLHHDYPYERWEALRRPIADCVDRSGSFLDIGCANGYLLECVLRWTAERGVSIDPFGLDISDKLADLARERLPAYADHVFTGNAWNWIPPRRFDYVRTELDYVPDELHAPFVRRILDLFLHPGGWLLAAEYRGRSVSSSGDIRQTPEGPLTIDRHLERLGFAVDSIAIGSWEGEEMVRIAVVGEGTNR
jgi:SAM-dependent methyltransferase